MNTSWLISWGVEGNEEEQNINNANFDQFLFLYKITFISISQFFKFNTRTTLKSQELILFVSE